MSALTLLVVVRGAPSWARYVAMAARRISNSVAPSVLAWLPPATSRPEPQPPSRISGFSRKLASHRSVLHPMVQQGRARAPKVQNDIISFEVIVRGIVLSKEPEVGSLIDRALPGHPK